MKTNILFASVVLNACLLSASARQADRPFDGIWVGAETVQILAMINQKGETFGKPASLVIADSGKSLTILHGIYPGRYQVLEEWPRQNTFLDGGPSGPALFFLPLSMSPLKMRFGRASKLVLSADGKTLTEVGVAFLPGTRGGSNWQIYSHVTGTFHRQGRK
jgi:hypothetical protein